MFEKRVLCNEERTPPGWNNWVRTAIRWMKGRRDDALKNGSRAGNRKELWAK